MSIHRHRAFCTLTPELTAVFDNADATGLTHLGNGRYYDPTLGRPLQPSAHGGIPVVPQSLNRYAASALGQVGVADGVVSTSASLAWLQEQALKTPVGLLLGQSAERQWGDALAVELKRTVRYQSFSSIGGNIVNQRSDMIVPLTSVRQKLGYWRESGFLYGRQTSRIGQSVLRTSTGVSPRTGGSPYQDVQILTEKISPNYIGYKGLVADFGIGLILDIGFQAYGDFGNPYLTSEQRWRRIGISARGSVAITWLGLGIRAGLIYIGVGSGPAGWVALGLSLGADYAWEQYVKPAIFESRGLNENVRLKPLGAR